MLVLLCSLAFADVVGPDPEDCPAGSVGTSSHYGEYCVSRSCDSCQGNCCEVGLCIVHRSEPSYWDSGTIEWDEVSGVCGAANSCASGNCVVADRCVGELTCEQTDGGGGGAGGSGICGCAATGSGALVVWLVALGGLLVRRR